LVPVLFAAAQGAAATKVQVLVDKDNKASSGCSVTLQRSNVDFGGAPDTVIAKTTRPKVGTEELFPGVEERITATVDASPTGYSITKIERESCNTNGTLSPPVTISNTVVPITGGQGVAGGTAVEIVVAPASIGIAPASGDVVRVAVQTDAGNGNAGAVSGLTGTGGTPLTSVVGAANLAAEAVPVGGAGVLVGLAILMLWLASRVMRHRGVVMLLLGAAGTLLLFAHRDDLRAQATRFVVDGLVDDWRGIAPLYTFTQVNGQSGAETTGVYVRIDGLTAAFRVDTVLNAPPQADSKTITAVAGRGTPVTLSGRDLEGAPITFAVVSQPRNGQLSGTAPALVYTPNAGFSGADSFDYKTRDGFQDSAVATVTIDVQSPPTITSADSATFVAGAASSFTVRSTARPVAVLRTASALPAGVTFTDRGDGTGNLAGTPTPAAAADYPITFTASNGVAPEASQAFTLKVVRVGTFTSPTAIDGVEGQPLDFAITTDAVPPVNSLRLEGTLPTGLAFSHVAGQPTARISGTPAVGSRGTRTLSVFASNGVGAEVGQALTLNIAAVNQRPSFTPGPRVTVNEDAPPVNLAGWATAISAGNGEAGQALQFVVQGNSNPTLFSAGPALSPSGTLSFTPAPDAFGSADITLVLKDDGGTANSGQDSSLPQTLSITVQPVNDPPRFSKGPDVVVPAGSAAHVAANWATGIVPGPANEAGQAVSFGINVVSGAGLFTVAPRIASDGTLTFTPGAAGGQASVSVVARDDGGIANGGADTSLPQSLNITLTEPLAFTSPATAAFMQGTAGTFSVSTRGFPPASEVQLAACTLPAGLTFTASGSGGTISGTPSIAGETSCTLTARNGVGADATQTLMVSVTPATTAPAITSPAAANFIQGQAGSFGITTTGSPAVSVLTLTGCTLPAGLTFMATGSGGTIAGTPLTAGQTSCTLTARNGVGADATQTLMVSVAPATTAPGITSPAAANFVQGQSGRFAITTTGSPAVSVLTLTGCTLPAGLSFSGMGGSGEISGTPTVAGSVTCLVTADNGVPPAAQQMLTVTVQPATVAPAIVSPALATFVQGQMSSFDILTTGMPAVTSLTLSGCTLHPGLNFVGSGNTARISGSTNNVGSVFCTLTASNGVPPAAVQQLTVTVTATPAPPSITSPSVARFTQGMPSNYNITTAGTPNVSSITLSGCTLPVGLGFSTVGATASIGGTPASFGTVTCLVTASNGVAPDATQMLSIEVAPFGGPPTITSPNMANFSQAVNGTFTITTSGTPAVTSITLQECALPAGLTLTPSGATATLSGTPSVSGTTNCMVVASSAHPEPAIQTLTINVAPGTPPAITSPGVAPFFTNVPGTFTITTTGMPAVSMISLTGCSLPAGLTFTPMGSTATISGSTLMAGPLLCMVTANNGVNPPASQNLVVNVQPSVPPSFTSPMVATFIAGMAGSFTINTAGGPPVSSIMLGGCMLPGGLSFNPGGASATISGTAASPATVMCTLTASNGVMPDGMQSLTVDVLMPVAPMITSPNMSNFSVGANGTFTITTSGVPPVNLISLTGCTLPPGLTFSHMPGAPTATISGTASAPAMDTCTITASNGVMPDAMQSHTTQATP
jgi:hypothetical protein